MPDARELQVQRTLPLIFFHSHRDVLCDLMIWLDVKVENISFSSLLIGMCFATADLRHAWMRGAYSFSSLLIGMCFATLT